MGGGRRILRVTGVLVPIMGLIYVAAAVIVVVMHINLIPHVFSMILPMLLISGPFWAAFPDPVSCSA